eukprot:TRINITY_DN9922_c0_g1_i2.p1 TRINITY_DN9922_c0_g1~~TRINITY_DN9922_c0_g1_i2.p1  ORF type:complete len:391 (+),score=55.57 TRINITY_DN9922_c0_g1_i2:173-1174(+)
MGNRNSGAQRIVNPANAIVNRLAEANPELGSAIFAQQRRFQEIMQVNTGASIKKKSLIVCKVGDAFSLRFRFDAVRDCSITVQQLAQELSPAEIESVRPELPIGRMEAKPGENQEFFDEKFIFLPEELILTCRRYKQIFGIIVNIRAEVSAGVTLEERSYANVEVSPSGSLLVPVVRQTLFTGKEVYALFGVFGDSSEDLSGKECIICLTADKDTMILPCRHLAICHNCAVQVSMEMKKCPICRKKIASMLNLRAVELTPQNRTNPSLLFLSLIHISEPTRPLYISYAVFCLKKKKKKNNTNKTHQQGQSNNHVTAQTRINRHKTYSAKGVQP